MEQIELLNWCTKLAEGVPHSAMVLKKLLLDPRSAALDILAIEEMGLRGKDIWIAYKDHCGESLEAFRDCLGGRDPLMLKTVAENKESE